MIILRFSDPGRDVTLPRLHVTIWPYSCVDLASGDVIPPYPLDFNRSSSVSNSQLAKRLRSQCVLLLKWVPLLLKWLGNTGSSKERHLGCIEILGNTSVAIVTSQRLFELWTNLNNKLSQWILRFWHLLSIFDAHKIWIHDKNSTWAKFHLFNSANAMQHNQQTDKDLICSRKGPVD